MAIVLNVFYAGDAARRFADAVASSGLLSNVRAEDGCERYEYFHSAEGGTVLLVERWRDQAAFRSHLDGEPLKGIRALQSEMGVESVAERLDPVGGA